MTRRRSDITANTNALRDTLDQYIAIPHERVKGIGSWQAVIQLSSSESECHISIADGVVRVGDGLHIRPTAQLAGDSKALVSGLRGDIDFTQLLARGLVTVSGRYMDMINLSRLAALARRNAAREAARNAG